MSLDRRRFLLAGTVAALAAACGTTNDAVGTGGAGTAGGASGATGPADPSSSTPAPGTSGGDDGGATTVKPGATSATPRTARFVATGPTDRQAVALTFHTNGDLKMFQSVLDTVEQHRGAITAFIVGDWLDANPAMGQRLTRGRHELANHTYTHPTFEKLSPSVMTTEITRCRDAIAKTQGSGGRWFRPSGTDDGLAQPSAATLAAAGAAGYEAVIGFDVDPFDYKDPGKDVVVQRTLAQAKAGSIISLHMGHAGTVSAMPAIMEGLASRSLEAVSLATLLDGRR